ncbi:LPS assembly lipoprotein LptE [Thermithiobacillus plumbiphilus]|uniref:LPS assembly lipoprotein LptE n=1 Tax=Thermithiobacillus plumbiphilus TaxID=1729899 RepID=A0ABU9DA91_9PROT
MIPISALPDALARLRTSLVILAACLLLASCGFHLRGGAPLPEILAGINVTAAGGNDAPIVRDLRERTSLVDGKAAGKDAPTLVVSGTGIEQRVASIDTQGVAREFLLVLNTRYQLLAADGKTLIPPQTLELQRDYTYTDNNVLASDIQSRELHEELYRAGAEQILRAVSIYQTHHPEPQP